MIVTPTTPIPYALAAYIRSIASSIGQWVAVSGGRWTDWPAVFLPLMTAIDGWLTIGLVPQSTLMAAAVLRRLSGKMKRYSAVEVSADTFVQLPRNLARVGIATDETWPSRMTQEIGK